LNLNKPCQVEKGIQSRYAAMLAKKAPDKKVAHINTFSQLDLFDDSHVLRSNPSCSLESHTSFFYSFLDSILLENKSHVQPNAAEIT